jgi:hypothetical protein
MSGCSAAIDCRRSHRVASRHNAGSETMAALHPGGQRRFPVSRAFQLHPSPNKSAGDGGIYRRSGAFYFDAGPAIEIAGPYTAISFNLPSSSSSPSPGRSGTSM